MKTSLRLLLLCAFVCLVSSAASAQQKARQKPGTARPICKVQSVPNGMVIVAHKPNAACAEGFEFIVKKPAPAEKVCANSPIPEGYKVEDTAGSTACSGQNPLTNAYMIVSGDGFYGIKVGMTSMEVWDRWGRPVETLRGTPGNSQKGITYRYRGSFGSTIYVYVEWADIDYRVIGFEEHQARN
jgi:hypothetical protein